MCTTRRTSGYRRAHWITSFQELYFLWTITVFDSKQTWDRVMLSAVSRVFISVRFADTHFSCTWLSSCVRAGESCSFWCLPSPRAGVPEVSGTEEHTSVAGRVLPPLSLCVRPCPPGRWVSRGEVVQTLHLSRITKMPYMVKWTVDLIRVSLVLQQKHTLRLKRSSREAEGTGDSDLHGPVLWLQTTCLFRLIKMNWS